MRISKELETELTAILVDYWDSYFRGDLETWAAYLPDNYHSIGTNENEIWTSKQQIVDFTHEVLEQMVGLVQVRDRQFRFIPVHPYVMAHEFGNIYIKSGNDWAFYSKMRLSSLLDKTKDGWKILHQHGSYPDNRLEQGEFFGFENILKENTELRAAVKRRTIELEIKNRELEIEAAVERVRARAMAMYQTNDLAKVNEELFAQLTKLNIEGFTGVAIYLVDEAEMVTVWDLSSPGSMGDANSHAFKYDSKQKPVLGEFVPIWRSAKQEYFILDFPAEKLLQGADELEDSYPAMAENFRKAISSGVLQHQWNASGRLSNGALSLDLTRPPTEEVKSITLKMAGAFNLAYQRFLDLQKAEAQARESQVQLALERIRARTMAMHKSAELAEVAGLLVEQVKQLGLESYSSGFNIWDEEHKNLISWMSNPSGMMNPPFEMPIHSYEQHLRIYSSWENGEILMEDDLIGEPLAKHYEFLWSFPFLKEAFINAEQAGISTPERQVHNIAFFSKGYLLFITPDRCQQYHHIFIQFAKVFEQTYTRFLDLQKAEAQAREAQIEAALEKVRSRSLAMHHSEEIKEVVKTVVEKITELNIEMNGGVSLVTFAPDSKDLVHWIWIPEQFKEPFNAYLPYFDNPMFHDCDGAREAGLELIGKVYSGKIKDDYFNHIFQYSGFKDAPEDLKTWVKQQDSFGFSLAIQKHSGIFLNDYTGKLFSNETNEILKRFSKVFEQSYVRFLDLQKAEEQTRAAQIELAVERVRAKALAMHSSTQILDVVATLRNEMLGLEIPGVVAATIYLQEEDGYMRMWDLSSVVEMESGFQVALDVKFKLDETDPGLYMRKVWINKNNYFVEKQEPADMAITIDWLRQYYPTQADEVQQFMDTTPWKYLLHPTIQLAQGKMSVDILDTQPPADMESILTKMGAAFDLAYKRFLDLQRSEEQIREGQIELALERVRARTMAMQHSDELADASFELDSQVRALGIQTWGCAFNIYGDNDSTEWFSSAMGTMPTYKTPRENVFLRYYNAGENGEAIHIETFEGEDCAAHYEYLCTIPIIGDGLKAMIETGGSFPTRQIDHVAYFKYGYLLFITFEPAPESHAIFIRFAKVFEQTYTRFIDLQKAEEQTKEAQIELSLERIRARVTAMKVSSDLLDIVVTMRTEFVALGHEAGYFWHMRWQPDIYEKAMTAADGTRIGNVMTLPRYMHHDIPVLADWEKSKDPSVVYAMEAEAAVDYVHKMITLGDFERVDPNAPTLDDIRHIGGLTFIMARTTHGEIGYTLPGPVPHPPADGIATLVRFAAVFDLAYRRFEDLKSSEKQIREAQIELALERVRARTMAMQHSDELLEAATVMFKQIESLGASAWNCSFNIWTEDKKEAIAWNGTKDGFGRPFNTPSSKDVFVDFYNASQAGDELYVKEMGGKELELHYEFLSGLPGVGATLKELKEAGITLPVFQVFNIAYFAQGYLMFITYEAAPEFANIFKRFAKVFEQTYTRFLDLQKAEAQTERAEQDLIEIKNARRKAEDALSELRSTQTQLIQSEKMASLGELTAGIAHEIQNPLNFINNFSELSSELIDEILEEVTKENFEEVKLIVGDIRQNLEKINHHGKRADSIVKGMLQHSRSSSGQKEPTNINTLADEYLRLAYHGIRAKDKSFNAILKTDYDETIANINIVPQDIGRVILNLITNAFFAVGERKKKEDVNYQPTITLSTQSPSVVEGSGVVKIKISDNGLGIPAHIKDKIFQPFFTTKPTGQGTGLGLSLAYDIIKAHGGDLKVETKEGSGTTFTIQLPAQ